MPYAPLDTMLFLNLSEVWLVRVWEVCGVVLCGDPASCGCVCENPPVLARVAGSVAGSRSACGQFPQGFLPGNSAREISRRMCP